MAITEAHVGRRYPTSAPYEVSAVKIAEFAAALGEEVTYDAENDAVVPFTFVAVITTAAWQAMFDDPELDLALSRMVHGDQRFDIVKPLHAGDRVTATLIIDKVRSRGAGEIITVSVEICSTSNELHCIATATLYHTQSVTHEVVV